MAKDANNAICSDGEGLDMSPRTLSYDDWFWSSGGRYCPERFERFLRITGYRNGREGLRPVLPEGLQQDSLELQAKQRKRGFAPEVTYFARGIFTGRIKIGLTRQRPEVRVKELRYANNGEEAELLCYLRGGDFERTYHRLFYTWADGNEWFAPHPDILAEIEAIKAGEVK